MPSLMLLPVLLPVLEGYGIERDDEWIEERAERLALLIRQLDIAIQLSL